jgi:hypothetical protein
MADEACARAELRFSDPAVATAACEEARAKVDKAAWIEIERAAKDGRQPDLVLDDLMPGLPTARAASAPDALAQLNKHETELAVAMDAGSHQAYVSPNPRSVSISDNSGIANYTNNDSATFRARSTAQNVIRNQRDAEVPHRPATQDVTQPQEGLPAISEANVLVLPQASPEFIGVWCGRTNLTHTNATGSDVPPQFLNFCYEFRRDGQQIAIVGKLLKGERARDSSSLPESAFLAPARSSVCR